MRHFYLAASAVAAFLAVPLQAAPVIHADPAGPILVDGSCEDAVWQAATRHEIGLEATVSFVANNDFLYVCVEAPAKSYANVDLYFLSGTLLHNLHASAQLGERLKSPSGWPEFQWWNQKGWTANWLAYVGPRTENGRQLPPFRFAPGREFQIARSKFPGTELRLMLHVHELATETGMQGEVRYPARAREEDPQSWTTLHIPEASARIGNPDAS
jgi:hypothetical protein